MGDIIKMILGLLWAASMTWLSVVNLALLFRFAMGAKTEADILMEAVTSSLGIISAILVWRLFFQSVRPGVKVIIKDIEESDQ